MRDQASSKWNLVWGIPWLFFTWFFTELLLWLPVYLLGRGVVPVLARHARIVKVKSRVWPDKMILAYANPVFDELFGNHEDGLWCYDSWWAETCGESVPTPKGICAWFCRNNVDNMRFWPVISTKVSPDKIRWIGHDRFEPDPTPCWYLCWQGPYWSWRWQTTVWIFWKRTTETGSTWCWQKKIRIIWVGWKLEPNDRFGVKNNDYRKDGVGVGTQFIHEDPPPEKRPSRLGNRRHHWA